MSSQNNLLNHIVGFEEGAARKEAREKVGGDFSDQKWKTANDIANSNRLPLDHTMMNKIYSRVFIF